MKISEISNYVETNEDKGLVASVKKILRAYEQTFGEDVDVLYLLGNIEQFFTRMQDRYENAFTIRNILSGQQKLLDLPIIREKLSDSQHKMLQEVTRSRASTFTKTANDKQRTKAKVMPEEVRPSLETEAEAEGELIVAEAAMSESPGDTLDESILAESEQKIEEQEGRIEEQARQIEQLRGEVVKLKSFIGAVKVILNLMD